MTVAITQDAKTLSDRFAESRSTLPSFAPVTFWTAGDSSTVTFAVTKGFYPHMVYVAGALMRSGTGEDYTVSFDGFVYSVVFAVAPAAVDVGFVCWRV